MGSDTLRPAARGGRDIDLDFVGARKKRESGRELVAAEVCHGDRSEVSAGRRSHEKHDALRIDLVAGPLTFPCPPPGVELRQAAGGESGW